MLLRCCLSVLCCLVAAAPSAAPVRATGDRIATQGLPDRGVTACMGCHAPDGSGMAASGFPRIAGMRADYLARQLRAFADGTRQNAVMAPIASGLSEDDIQAVSSYYACLPVPATDAGSDASAQAPAAGRDLALNGDWTRRTLPACSQCHGADGNGIGDVFPGLSGQHASYVKAQIEAWRAGTRRGDPLGLMQSVATQMTDAEIDAVAAYYATLPAGKPANAANVRLRPTGTPPAVSTDEIHAADLPHHGPTPPARAANGAPGFASPPRWAVPDGPFGDSIRLGEALFRDTNTHPMSAKFVGNDQACGHCHLDLGRRADASPMWAAYVAYPAYRAKNRRINSFVERVQGCFRYSMNAQDSAAGAPPSADSEVVAALQTYSYWLALGAPTGDQSMPGRGYPKLADPAQPPDHQRGARVYAEKCALCHGSDGQGVVTVGGRTVFPPLWGAGAYNWGAGMHRVDTAAAFIRHNMPLGLRDALTDQEAWDLAHFVNTHERPQDPRFTGDLAETAAKFHADGHSLYGRPGPDGALLGSAPAKRR